MSPVAEIDLAEPRSHRIAWLLRSLRIERGLDIDEVAGPCFPPSISVAEIEAGSLRNSATLALGAASMCARMDVARRIDDADLDAISAYLGLRCSTFVGLIGRDQTARKFAKARRAYDGPPSSPSGGLDQVA